MSLRDGMWSGLPCVIVGGGPSLRGYDFSGLDELSLFGMRTVAVNRAAEFFDPDAWIGMDRPFWVGAGDRRLGAMRPWPRCPRVWVNHNGDKAPGPVTDVLPCAATPATPNRHSALAWGRTLGEGLGCGGNSGFAALNLAEILGADPIYLLGFDMKGEGGEVTHFHDGYAEKPPSDVLCDRWLDAFRWAAKQVRARVVTLEVSLGDSRLDCFEKALADDVL